LRITVAICTRNRAARLRSVLNSMSRMIVPNDLDWELCIVDNGSSDETREIIESFSEELPVRYLLESQPGISHARNLAVEEAHGDYICWTDDDVEVDSQWLIAYAAAFVRHPEAAVFGGRILPRLEPPTPAWFTESMNSWPLQALLAARDFGDEILPLSFATKTVPWWANAALRMTEQKQHLYDTNLGVSPLQRRLGEEADVTFKILRGGGVGWWVPEAKVNHIIPAHRQTWAYIYDYFSAMGETLAYMEKIAPGANFLWHDSPKPSPVSAGPLVLHRRRARAALSYGLARLVCSNERAVDSLRQVGFFSGALAFNRGARRVRATHSTSYWR
jgi:glycosyltransferase involved in cell wall biosynthesis